MEKTALYDNHVKRGGKIVPFGGYSLPVWFSSLKEEHLAVRNNVGAFDISHMGVFRITKGDPFKFLQKISCNDLTKIKEDKMVYSMILNEKGTILDDVMIGKTGDHYVMVVNASNKEKLLSWFNAAGQEGAEIEDLSSTYSFIAIQGPNAIEKAKEVINLDVSEKPRFSVFGTEVLGKKCLVMRTGYTGEDGMEIVVPNDHIEKVWDTLIDGGITPCGLGARDSLRLEAGLPLYGQELSEEIHPYMTRYSWVVKLKNEFIGKEALVKYKEAPKEWVTVGLEMEDRVIPRTGYPVSEGGKVTSGTLSPSLDKPIAMAMVKPSFAEIGSTVTIEIRGKEHKAKVVKVPFIDS